MIVDSLDSFSEVSLSSLFPFVSPQDSLAQADMAEIIAVSSGLLLPSTMNAMFQVQEDAVTAAGPPASQSSEDYLFVETRHPNTVLQGLNSLRLNNAFCDVTLCCGGQEFPCHRIVLASFSSYFQVNSPPVTYMSKARGHGLVCKNTFLSFSNLQAMFSADLIESKQERVAINGVEPQMIGMLVSYAYTSEVYISKANVQVSSLFPPFL